MTDKRKKTGSERLTSHNVRQDVACQNTAEKQPGQPGSIRRDRPASLESVSSKKRSAGSDRFARENLKVKKKMAMAMLQMGISKKDVMQILNIMIK